jgi:hypothetical protein
MFGSGMGLRYRIRMEREGAVKFMEFEFHDLRDSGNINVIVDSIVEWRHTNEH